MHKTTFEYTGEFARKDGAQGQPQGRQERRQEWFQEGVEEGLRAALIEVLDARGLPLKETTRQRIQASSEVSVLERWLRKAVSVQSAQRIFGRKPAARPAARKAAKRARSVKASKPRPKR